MFPVEEQEETPFCYYDDFQVKKY